MICPWRDRIAELEEGPDMEHHVSQCPECRQLRAGLLADLEEMAAAHEEPLPVAHYAAVRARVWSELQSKRRRRIWNWVWAGGCAALVAAALALAPGPLAVAPPAVVRLPAPPPPILPPVLPVARRHLHPRHPVSARSAGPVTVKLLTDDPNVVIYWIIDQQGD